jgi:hypothetical protein
VPPPAAAATQHQQQPFSRQQSGTADQGGYDPLNPDWFVSNLLAYLVELTDYFGPIIWLIWSNSPWLISLFG